MLNETTAFDGLVVASLCRVPAAATYDNSLFAHVHFRLVCVPQSVLWTAVLGAPLYPLCPLWQRSPRASVRALAINTYFCLFACCIGREIESPTFTKKKSLPQLKYADPFVDYPIVRKTNPCLIVLHDLLKVFFFKCAYGLVYVFFLFAGCSVNSSLSLWST